MNQSLSILVLVLYVSMTTVSTKSATSHWKKVNRNIPKENRLPETELAQNQTQEKERWLVDEIDYPVYDYQGDAPDDSLDNAKCPPYPEKKSRRACRARECKTDNDCRRSSQRCCFNGCKFTCTMEMTGPAVVDWRRPPRRQSHSGNAWLVRGSSEDDGVEPCTTTRYPDDGDPLLCPHGYICHIVDPGDPKTGIPNRGQCIANKKDEDKTRSRQKILGADLRRSGMCRIGLTVIRDQTVLLRGDEKEKCICQRGTILCGDKFSEPTSGR